VCRSAYPAALVSVANVVTRIIDSTIAENRVIAKYNGRGGGYYSTSQTLTMTRCSISANSLQVIGQAGSATALSGLGGGLCVGGSRCQVALQWCNITANVVNVTGLSALATAAAGGGAIAVEGTSNRGNLTATWVRNNMVMQQDPALTSPSTYARGGGVIVLSSCELSMIGRSVSGFANNRVQGPTRREGGATFVSLTGTLRMGMARVIPDTSAWPANTVINTVETETTPAPTMAPLLISISLVTPKQQQVSRSQNLLPCHGLVEVELLTLG
jgi:hypothetical protein